MSTELLTRRRLPTSLGHRLSAFDYADLIESTEKLEVHDAPLAVMILGRLLAAHAAVNEDKAEDKNETK